MYSIDSLQYSSSLLRTKEKQKNLSSSISFEEEKEEPLNLFLSCLSSSSPFVSGLQKTFSKLLQLSSFFSSSHKGFHYYYYCMSHQFKLLMVKSNRNVCGILFLVFGFFPYYFLLSFFLFLVFFDYIVFPHLKLQSLEIRRTWHSTLFLALILSREIK